MSRVIVCLCCLVMSWLSLSAQSLDVVALGGIAGEMGKFESKLHWENTSEDTLTIALWSDNEKLTFIDNSLKVLPQSTASIAYTINLSDTKGEKNYEVRLIGAQEIVLHGFLLKARIFEAESDVFRAYRNDFFPFRAANQVFNLKSAFRGETLSEQYSLYNFGGKTLDLKGVMTSMPGLSATFESEEVPHHTFTRMTLRLESTQVSLGFTRDKVNLMSPDSSIIATIPVQFTLEEKPEQHIDGPHLTISRLTHNLKVIKAGEQRTVNITLANNGRSVLNLEKVESNCDCLTYDLPVSSLAPGKSATLKVTYDATERVGYERKTLALFTNDPDQPTRVITFKAQVK